MECYSCHSSAIIYNSDLMSTVCTNCGAIQSETPIINENTFTDQEKIGCPSFDLLLKNNIISSNDKKLTTIINSIIVKLNLPKFFLERAKRYYNCCVNKSFLKGRSMLLVITTIIYVLCRINKIHYLLLDFSEISKINLYRLGTCFLDFIQVVQIELQVIDPYLLIKRFCNKLEINSMEKSNEICRIALKIIQCMKKDWICEGRNPSGVCGAAIYISLVLNNYQGNLDIVSDIVKINKETIMKRINEFKETSYSKLTKDDFVKLDINKILQNTERDPPIFITNQIKDGDKERENKISNCINKNNSIGDSITKCGSFLSLTKFESSDDLFFEIPQLNLSKACENTKFVENSDLSDLSENECDEYIENPEMYKIKKALWEEKNKDWLREQGYKAKSNIKRPLTRKRRRKINKGDDINAVKYKSAKEAILHNEKLLKMRIKSKMHFMNNLLEKVDSISVHNRIKF